MLQLYTPLDLATPANRALAALVEQWRAAVDGAPVAIVEDQHLHITLVIYSCQANQPVNEFSGCQPR